MAKGLLQPSDLTSDTYGKTHSAQCFLMFCYSWPFQLGEAIFLSACADTEIRTMNLEGNRVLITGGTSGIGLALAKEYVKHGSEVLITGRRDEMIEAARRELPEAKCFKCDLREEQERMKLIEWAVTVAGGFNVLINNAGIQQELNFEAGVTSEEIEREIMTNLIAPMHLASLAIPHLKMHPSSAIMNVTSGLGFMPLAIMPAYCASKAAMHSFSITLRHQLRNTPVRVFELIPGIVDTDLDKGARVRRGVTDFGISPEECAHLAFESIAQDQFEAPLGGAKFLVEASRSNFAEVFGRMNPIEARL